jgi:hypothetical protein
MSQASISFGYEVGSPQRQEDKNLLVLPETTPRFPGRPTYKVVTIPTELLQLK